MPLLQFAVLVGLLLLSAHGACSNSNATRLTSPAFPGNYPPAYTEEWTFNSSSNEQVNITINRLDLREPWDTLTITHVSPSLSEIFVAQVRGAAKGFVFPSGVTYVTFCSDITPAFGFDGFELDVIIANDDVNLAEEGSPDAATYACASGMQLIAVGAQCDGVLDCHDASDDRDCSEQLFGDTCPAAFFRCPGSPELLCIAEDRVCDGIDDCPLRGDEQNCETVKCPSDCSCGESAFDGRYGPDEPPCRESGWLPFWVNCSSGWDRDYTSNTATKATILNLNGAPSKELQAGVFDGLSNVHTLDISSNQLDRFIPGVFDGLSRLVKIIAVNNSVTYLENGAFRGLYNLRLLYLDDNKITQLHDGCFQDLDSLFFIGLGPNSLSDIQPGAFQDLGKSLERLVLEGNNLTSVNSTLFDGIRDGLLLVSFENNPVTNVEPGSFANLTDVTDLYLLLTAPSPLQLYPEFFDGLDNLTSVYAYDPRVCCIAPSQTQCNLRVPAEPLFTCRRTLLHNGAIKFFMWFLALAALIGNVFVLVTRLRTKHTNTITHVQSIMIGNLAVSDMLMGVYMLIIAISDAVLSDSFFWEGRSEAWRASSTCRFAGFLSFLSCEASIFLIVLISVDRFVCVVFPFNKRRLGVISAQIATAIVWVIALVLSMVSVLLSSLDPDAYDLSDVCVGLPLIRKNTNLRAEIDKDTLDSIGIEVEKIVAGSSASTWQYSVAVFLGLNFVCFTVTLLAYIAIFIKVRVSSVAVGRKAYSANEIRMAFKLSLIVATDFVCWMPIIVLGIIVQANDVYISPDVYAWLVALVLPINSAINPYLYTLVDHYTAAYSSKSTSSSTGGK